MPDIKVTNLTTQYMTQKATISAVDQVSFLLKNGESVGIAGESGCGKSTLGLSLIRSVQYGKIISGEVLFDDVSLLETSESEFTKKYRWKQISMVFQGAMNSLDPVFTIKEQFIELLKQHHYRGDFNDLIKKITASVDLEEEVLQKYPHQLSGGQKQRIIIAMALFLKPKFVIADEPTTALDVLVQAQIINLLKRLKKDGMSIMLITHDLAIISEIAEKIGIMYAGQMVEFGNAQQIYKNPKHPYTQALLKAIPSLHGEKKIEHIKGVPPNLSNPPSGCRYFDRCPHAMEKCKKEPPKLGSPSEYVMCWLYE